jgi:Heterokaryon incompatibility protein (HET)
MAHLLCLIPPLLAELPIASFNPSNNTFAFMIYNGCMSMHFKDILFSAYYLFDGTYTDLEFTAEMRSNEITTQIFFAPTIARLAWRLARMQPWLLWLIICLDILSALFLVELRKRFWLFDYSKLLLLFIEWLTSYTVPFWSIRGAILRVFDIVRIAIYQNDLAIARKHQSNLQNSEGRSEYKYGQLQTGRHVRLLQLRKRHSFSCEMVCELIHYNLNNAPSYEALSYTWGADPPSIPLKIDSQEILVTRGVQEFLFSQWSIFEDKLFWIDAVCINQKDDVEKSSQIPLMTTIYKQAKTVIVWLAPPDTHSNCVLARELIGDTTVEKMNLWAFLSQLSGKLLKETDDRLLEFARFFNSPWFSRMWVVQETAAATNLCIWYKGASFTWYHLIALQNTLEKDLMTSALILTAVRSSQTNVNHTITAEASSRGQTNIASFEIARSYFQSGKRIDLSMVLPFARSFGCRDPRDKIFSLFGLLEENERSGLDMSYSQPIEDLCRQFTIHLFSTERWFFALMAASWFRDPKGTNSLPSWVINLQYQPAWTFLSSMRIGKHHSQIPSADKSNKPVITDDPNVIQLECIVIGLVKKLGPPPYYPDGFMPSIPSLMSELEHQSEDLADRFKEWYFQNREFARSVLKHHVSNTQLADDEFWKACNHGLNDIGPWLQSPLLNQLEGVESSKVRQTLEATLGDHIPSDLNVHNTLLSLSGLAMSLAGRRMCHVSGNKLAIVSPTAETGDIVVYIRGGTEPAVLRPSSIDQKKAEIIGTCYVHGVDDVYQGDDWTTISII